MTPKILVVYIATREYNQFFTTFVSSLSTKFCQDIEKKVIYFTDEYLGVDEYGNELRTCDISAYNGVQITKVTVRHYPWPIVTLMKFQYIQEAIIKHSYGFNPTHVVYFNANIQFIKDIQFNEYFDNEKLTVVNHWAWSISNNNFVALGNNDYRSQAWINEPYTYTQACQVAGPIDKVNLMCSQINKWIQLDLTRNIIPRWHDESYYNRYVHEIEKLGLVKRLNEYYNGDEVNEDSRKLFDPAIIMLAKDNLEKLKHFEEIE